MACIGEKARGGVATEDLNLICIATGYEKEAFVWR